MHVLHFSRMSVTSHIETFEHLYVNVTLEANSDEDDDEAHFLIFCIYVCSRSFTGSGFTNTQT